MASRRRVYDLRKVGTSDVPVKPVEVLYNGVWCPGQMDYWARCDGIHPGWLVRQPDHPDTEETTWHAQVTWRNPDNRMNYINWVPTDCVRQPDLASDPQTDAGPRPEPEPC